MSPVLNIVALIISIVVSGFTAFVSIANFRIRREGERAKVHIDSSTAAGIDEKRERERQQHWDDREAQWQKRLQETEDRCNKQVSEQKAEANRRLDEQQLEINILEAYVDRIVPWTWGAVREIRLNSIELEDPPSLAEIRREFAKGNEK